MPAKCKHRNLDASSHCKECGVRVDLTVKRNKYGAKRTLVDGIRFDSAKEARRWTELKYDPTIFGLQRQPVFQIVVNGVHICDYRADFAFMRRPSSQIIVEDVKSKATKTAVYQLKKKLMLACHGIEVREA